MSKIIQSCKTCRLHVPGSPVLREACRHPDNSRIDRQRGRVFHIIDETVLARCAAGGWFRPKLIERLAALFRRARR